MVFDFNQAAKKRVKRATYAFMQAQKEYSRQKKPGVINVIRR